MDIQNRIIVPWRGRRGWFALLAAAVAAAVWAAGLASPEPAKAETVPLELKLEAGYQGKIKEDRWFPAHFTITNKGDALSGDLAVELASPYTGKDMMYHVHMDLPKGSTKTVSMALPGMPLNDRNNVVSFYKGSVKDGIKVPFADGNPSIATQSLPPNAYHVGVLARDPDTMNFLALLNQKGYQVSTVPLKLGETFSESMMLDGLDAIVVNDVPGTEWEPAQTEAVKTWLQRGGSLILAGGAGYAQTAAPFGELSPVQPDGTAALEQLGALEKAGGKGLKLTEPFTVSKGTLQKGSQALLAEASIPLIAVRNAGFGKVWYAAYDLSQQPVASWPGNAALWDTILSRELSPASSFKNGPGYASVGPAYWEIGQALENFPSLTPPSFDILLIVLLIYAAVAGPVIYMGLKRFDRREWAWLAIPGFAVIVSGGIYWFGASGRSDTLTQALTVVELNGQGQALERTAAAVFVPKGGTYTVTAAGNYHALPLGSSDSGIGTEGVLKGDSDVFVERKAEEALLRFEGVPFWSVRKAWLYGEQGQASGSIGYTLSMEAGVWKGEFKNNTSADLTDGYLYAGNQWYAIGDLAAGQTAAFNSRANTPGFTVTGFQAAQMLYPHQGPADPNGHKRALLQAYLEAAQLQSGSDPFIFGWSRRDNPSLLKVNGSAVAADELKLWVQPVEFNPVSGDSVYVPLGMVKPEVIGDGAKFGFVIPEPDGNIHLPRGETELLYRLPSLPGAVLDTLAEVKLYGESQMDQYEIWKEKSGKYEPLAGLKSGTKLTEYITSGGSAVRVKLTMKQDGMTRYPDFAFEGRVAR